MKTPSEIIQQLANDLHEHFKKNTQIERDSWADKINTLDERDINNFLLQYCVNNDIVIKSNKAN